MFKCIIRVRGSAKLSKAAKSVEAKSLAAFLFDLPTRPVEETSLGFVELCYFKAN